MSEIIGEPQTVTATQLCFTTQTCGSITSRPPACLIGPCLQQALLLLTSFISSALQCEGSHVPGVAISRVIRHTVLQGKPQTF